MSERYQQIVGKAQEAYRRNRAPELHGTPKLSEPFFPILQEEGLRSAWNDLVGRQNEVGDPTVSPKRKAAANLLGSVLLAIGVRQIAGIEELGRLVNPYRPNYGEKLPVKQRVGEVLFNLSMGLLFMAQDGGSKDGIDWFWSDASEHRKAGHRQIDMLLEEDQITPEEAEKLHKKFDKRHGWK